MLRDANRGLAARGSELIEERDKARRNATDRASERDEFAQRVTEVSRQLGSAEGEWRRQSGLVKGLEEKLAVVRHGSELMMRNRDRIRGERERRTEERDELRARLTELENDRVYVKDADGMHYRREDVETAAREHAAMEGVKARKDVEWRDREIASLRRRLAVFQDERRALAAGAKVLEGLFNGRSSDLGSTWTPEP